MIFNNELAVQTIPYLGMPQNSLSSYFLYNVQRCQTEHIGKECKQTVFTLSEPEIQVLNKIGLTETVTKI